MLLHTFYAAIYATNFCHFLLKPFSLAGTIWRNRRQITKIQILELDTVGLFYKIPINVRYSINDILNTYSATNLYKEDRSF